MINKLQDFDKVTISQIWGLDPALTAKVISSVDVLCIHKDAGRVNFAILLEPK